MFFKKWNLQILYHLYIYVLFCFQCCIPIHIALTENSSKTKEFIEMVSHNLEDLPNCDENTRIKIQYRSYVLAIYSIFLLMEMIYSLYLWMPYFNEGKLVFLFASIAKETTGKMSALFDVFSLISICVFGYSVFISSIFVFHIYHYYMSFLEITSANILHYLEKESQDDLIYGKLMEMIKMLNTVYK